MRCMNCQQRILAIREMTGLNRREFCDYFQIPYRTVTDWEHGVRNAPEYVIRLLEYYIQNNAPCGRKEGEHGTER